MHIPEKIKDYAGVALTTVGAMTAIGGVVAEIKPAFQEGVGYFMEQFYGDDDAATDIDANETEVSETTYATVQVGDGEREIIIAPEADDSSPVTNVLITIGGGVFLLAGVGLMSEDRLNCSHVRR